MKNFINRLYWIVSTQIGIDPRALMRSLKTFPRFYRDMQRFRSGSNAGALEIRPCLQDWQKEGGEIKNEYFWQDLLAAQEIYNAKPERHVDVGSRIDGFVAHVASFRPIEIFDVRPVGVTIPNVTFRQADLMSPIDSLENYCDSLSCLHALEHFGLGRYGDPVDSCGHEKGIGCMARLLKKGGLFYLSVPVGRARIEFNAHRIFSPKEIVRLATSNSLSLTLLTLIYEDGSVEKFTPDSIPYDKIESFRYVLGMFKFTKTFQ